MIRLREILDPDLRLRIRDAIARRRGMSPAAVPEWFEMDDADFVDLLNDIRDGGESDDLDPLDRPYDPRM
jgi:hypothetical protein